MAAAAAASPSPASSAPSSSSSSSAAALDFKAAHSFESRVEESRRIKERFPGRVPIIVQRAAKSVDVPQIDKAKFLCPGDLNVSQFVHVIRRRLQLSSEQALFLFVGNTLPTTGTLLRELYATYADADGFLYCHYSGESTFGGHDSGAGAGAGAAPPHRRGHAEAEPPSLAAATATTTATASGRA